MRAVTWQGKRKVRVDTVPDPVIEKPTDAVIGVTTTNICGSDLHLYEVLGAFMTAGDVLGHEPMGIVEEVGRAVTNLAPGDRVVIPFQIACGHCCMCATACRPSATPPGCVNRTPAPPCSATPSSTARFRAGKPSTCECRKRTTPISKCRTGRLTTVRLSVRRAADRVAGGRLRRRTGRRVRDRARTRADRRHGGPNRHPSGGRG